MISIITSLYNSQDHLATYIHNTEECSLALTQAGIIHEFLIIFNSPNELEKEFLRQLQTKAHIPTRIIICDREPLYATWNRGIKEAAYPHITFWNVDDNRFPNAIIGGLQRMQEGFDVVYFPFIYKRYVKIFGFKVLVKIKITKTIPFDQTLFLKGMYIGPFFMVRKSIFDKVGFFDDTFKIAGDFDWAVRATKSGVKFIKSDIIGGTFTNDGTTLSGSRSDLLQTENKRITGIL